MFLYASDVSYVSATGGVDSASPVDSLGVGVELHIVLLDELPQHLIVGPDHPPSVEEVEVRHSAIYREDVGLQLPGGHAGDVLHLVLGAGEGDDGECRGVHILIIALDKIVYINY